MILVRYLKNLYLILVSTQHIVANRLKVKLIISNFANQILILTN